LIPVLRFYHPKNKKNKKTLWKNTQRLQAAAANEA
jgi:hypothetical protein